MDSRRVGYAKCLAWNSNTSWVYKSSEGIVDDLEANVLGIAKEEGVNF